MSRIAVAIALSIVTLLAAAGPASACCKAKFERTKPHVNVGTIGPANGQGSGARSDGQTAVIGGIGGLRKSDPPAADKRSLMILITPKITTPAK